MRESLTKLNGCAQLYLQTEEHRAFAARRGIAAPSRSPPPRSPPRTGSGAPRATPHGAAAAPLALTPPAAARLAKQRPQGGGTELARGVGGGGGGDGDGGGVGGGGGGGGGGGVSVQLLRGLVQPIALLVITKAMLLGRCR